GATVTTNACRFSRSLPRHSPARGSSPLPMSTSYERDGVATGMLIMNIHHSVWGVWAGCALGGCGLDTTSCDIRAGDSGRCLGGELLPRVQQRREDGSAQNRKYSRQCPSGWNVDVVRPQHFEPHKNQHYRQSVMQVVKQVDHSRQGKVHRAQTENCEDI